MKKTEWFEEARFGMFIHWGLYSIPAEGEWIFARRDWKPGEYQSLMTQFNPVDFAPAQWAKLASAAGMKYVVFTTKHHDGFCMFDSQFTDYKVTNTAYGKDVTRMLVDAFRAEGIRIGFYHSLPDWTHPGYADPESPDVMIRKVMHIPTAEQHQQFLDYLYNNVEQLMTEYGKIDILFFDYTSKYKIDVDYFDRERLLEMIYRHQPEIIVNDRLSFLKEAVRDFDYYTPEITVMNHAPTVRGNPVVWESCATMNDHWGYFAGDENYKALETLTAGLAGCVSQNGNLLLNVGPEPTGKLPPLTIAKLQELAAWYQKHGEAIFGCGKSDFQAPFGLCYTQKNKNLYAYVLMPPMGDMIFPGLNGRIKSVSVLRNGEIGKLIDFWGFELLDKDEIRVRIPGLKPGDIIKLELN